MSHIEAGFRNFRSSFVINYIAVKSLSTVGFATFSLTRLACKPLRGCRSTYVLTMSFSLLSSAMSQHLLLAAKSTLEPMVAACLLFGR